MNCLSESLCKALKKNENTTIIDRYKLEVLAKNHFNQEQQYRNLFSLRVPSKIRKNTFGISCYGIIMPHLLTYLIVCLFLLQCFILLRDGCFRIVDTKLCKFPNTWRWFHGFHLNLAFTLLNITHFFLARWRWQSLTVLVSGPSFVETLFRGLEYRANTHSSWWSELLGCNWDEDQSLWRNKS